MDRVQAFRTSLTGTVGLLDTSAPLMVLDEEEGGACSFRRGWFFPHELLDRRDRRRSDATDEAAETGEERFEEEGGHWTLPWLFSPTL